MKRLFSVVATCALLCFFHSSTAQELWGTTRIGGENNNGTIFKINCDHTGHTSMYSLSADVLQGQYPYGSLVMHSNGMLYGLTRNGGPDGRGVLFEFNPITNTYAKKLNLTEDTGWNAYGSMVEAPNGKFYGTLSSAGWFSGGTFYEYTPGTNELRVITHFDGYNGGTPMGTPIIASNGKIYGTTALGGDEGGGVLFEYDVATDDFRKLIDFRNYDRSGHLSVGSGPYGAPVEAIPGKLFGVTGGNSIYASIYEYDIASNQITPRYNFPNDGLGNAPNGSLVKEALAQHSNGKLYGMASMGGVGGSGTLYEFDPSTGVFTKKIELNSEGLAVPRGALFELANGKMYGTVSTTPSGGNGAWFEYDPSINTITNKVFFQGTDGASPEFERLLYPSGKIFFNQLPAKSYGAAPFDLSATSNTGVDLFFTSSDPTVASVENKTVTIHKAGTTIITATPVDNSPTCSYGPPKPVQQLLTVSKIPLTVTAENKTKKYGQVNPALTIKYAGFVNNETASVLDVQPNISSPATTYSNVATYPIVVSGGNDDNYTYNFVNATLTIEKATLTITADNKQKTYGDSNPELTLSFAGFVGTDTYLVLDAQPSVSTTAVPFSGASSYPITVSGGSDNNYALTYKSGTLTINKKLVTVTANAASRIYGSANPDLTFSFSGFVPGENEAFIDLLPAITTEATQASDAGEYDISTLGAFDENYAFQYVAAKLTITKASLFIKADNQTRKYGNDNPEFSLSYAGFVMDDNKEDIDQPPFAETVADKSSNTGDYSIDISEGFDNNYLLHYESGTLTITKAAIAVKPDDKTRTYGSGDPGFTITYQGLLNEETPDVINVAPSVSSTAVAGSHPGNYPLTATGATDNNYEIIYLDGTLTITQAELTVIPDNLSRKYGEQNPPVGLSFSGFVNGEDQTVLDQLPVAISSADSRSPVGDYAIISSGGSDDDYKFKYLTGKLSVVKADQVLTFDLLPDRTLGESPFTLVASSTSGLSVAFASESSNVKIENSKLTILAAGRVTVTASQAGDENYFEAEPADRTFCVNPSKPSISVTGAVSPAPVLISSAASGNQWYLNEEKIEGATDKTYTTSAPGSYSVQITVDDCVSELSEVVPVVITGDLNDTSELKSYPNPVTSILYIEGLTGNPTFTIIDMSGKDIPVSAIHQNGSHQMDVNHLSAGMYVLFATTHESVKRFKFIKK